MVSAGILDKDCWPDWPQWECYAANCAGLVSTALWFIVLLPQVLKNWYRRSVVGLSFLWAVANFTASLVNLFFAFSVELPLYTRVSAVYMPILELTILFQFLIYSHKPVTTRLLGMLVCLLMWGTIIELELNLPESRDKVQWIAIALWSVESFPQIALNIKRQSTSGQASTSVLISLVGKTTDFLVTYGLLMPLPYVVMCYFSSSSTFINGFQVFWYGNESWFNPPQKKEEIPSTSKLVSTSKLDENTKLLEDTPYSDCGDKLLQSQPRSPIAKSQCRFCVVNVIRYIFMSYISFGLTVFAVGIYWRTRSYFALLAPLACLGIVVVASEYYNLKRRGHLKRCEEAKRKVEEVILTCGYRNSNSPHQNSNGGSDSIQ